MVWILISWVELIVLKIHGVDFDFVFHRLISSVIKFVGVNIQVNIELE